MSFYNGVLNFNDFSSRKGERGERGLPGIGFKLDENGNYDIQNKKLVNVKQGTNPNDAVTNSQIQSLDNSPGNVQADKAVIYSNTGSVHTNSVYLQDIPDGAGSFNSVRLMTEHQSYDNIHLHVPDLQNFDGYGGRAKSEIMVTSTEQHITGRKTFFDLNVVKPNNNDQAVNKKYVDDEIKKIPSPNLSAYVKKDGSVTMTGDLDMGNQQITNLGYNIQNSSDVVNLGFCDTKYLQKVSNSDLNMDNHRIKDMAQPVDNNDAVNKYYVEHNFLNRLTPNALGGDLDMRGHNITILGNPSNPNDASTKAYVDTEIAKIPSGGSDLSAYLKKDGSIPMTGNLDMNDKQIKSIAKPTDDNDATTKKYFEDRLEQSHLVSSHKTNEFKYLIDSDESSSEYNITVNGIVDFNESPHQNRKAYSIDLTKDAGTNNYRSRIGFNLYSLAIGTYTIVFEFYPPEMTNIQLSCTASSAYIHKSTQRDFTDYSKLLVQFNNNSKQTPDYIYLTMHGTATATPVQCHLVVYGVKDWSDSVYPDIYDGLDNVMFKYENGDMKMQTELDMNNKRIIHLSDPIDDGDAVNKLSLDSVSYFTKHHAYRSIFPEFYDLLETSRFGLVKGVTGVVINSVLPNFILETDRFINDYDVKNGLKFSTKTHIHTTKVFNQSSSFTFFMSFLHDETKTGTISWSNTRAFHIKFYPRFLITADQIKIDFLRGKQSISFTSDFKNKQLCIWICHDATQRLYKMALSNYNAHATKTLSGTINFQSNQFEIDYDGFVNKIGLVDKFIDVDSLDFHRILLEEKRNGSYLE